MDWWKARHEVYVLWRKWMSNRQNSIQELDVPGMLLSMISELRYRRTIQPGSPIVEEINAEFRFVKAALKAYPNIGREIN